MRGTIQSQAGGVLVLELFILHKDVIIGHLFLSYKDITITAIFNGHDNEAG